MQIHSAVPPSVRRLSVSLGRRSSSLGSLFMNDCRLFLPVSLPLSCLLSYPELNASPSSSRLPTRAVAHPSIVLTGIKHNNNTTRITHSSQSSKETASWMLISYHYSVPFWYPFRRRSCQPPIQQQQPHHQHHPLGLSVVRDRRTITIYTPESDMTRQWTSKKSGKTTFFSRRSQFNAPGPCRAIEMERGRRRWEDKKIEI